MEEDDTIWPPPPSVSSLTKERGVSKKPRAAMPYRGVISTMWLSTSVQIVLSLVWGRTGWSGLLGIVGFVLAVYLVTRGGKTAQVNGGLRLTIAALGFLFHMIASR